VEAIAKMIQEIQGASTARRAEIYAALEARCLDKDKNDVRSLIEKQARAQVLTVQWELEEILERTAPQVPTNPEEPPKTDSDTAPETEKSDPNTPLSESDVEVVYEDPRGLVLHKSKFGNRWLATQLDPNSGQPQTFELAAQEIEQIKDQLAQSPYWVLGKKPL
jgi:hypothetical protein